MLKILLPLAVVAYALSKKAGGLERLAYEITNVRVHRFTLPAKLELRVDVSFSNPSSQAYVVNSLRLNVAEGGDLVGDVFLNGEITIAPGTQTVVPFPLNVRLLTAARKLVPLLLAGKALPVLDVTGYITAEGVEKALPAQRLPLAPYDPRAALAPKPVVRPVAPTGRVPAQAPAGQAPAPARVPAPAPRRPVPVPKRRRRVPAPSQPPRR